MKFRKINPKMINDPQVFDYYKGTKEVEEDIIFLDEYYEIEKAPFFPIYIAERDENIREKKFIQAFTTIRDSYLNLGRDMILDKQFWYSLFLSVLKENIKREYPKSMDSEKDFRNIVLKKFDWENYVYKVVLGSEYIVEEVEDIAKHQSYFKLITENLDVYNYILKSEIFKNSTFLKNILDVIVKNDCSDITKAKVSDEVKKKLNIDIKSDERVGRRIVSEFNKSYPVVFVHALEYEEFEKFFLKFLNIYKD